MLSMMGAFAHGLTEKPGHLPITIVSFILIFSPPSQLILGIFVIFYRSPQYVLQDQGDAADIPAEGQTFDEISPFSKYGAKL